MAKTSYGAAGAGVSKADFAALVTRVDNVEAASDVVDIVATKAALDAYDKTTLTDNDIIKVLADETNSGNEAYWRYLKATDEFVFVGKGDNYLLKTGGMIALGGVISFEGFPLKLSGSGIEWLVNGDYGFVNSGGAKFFARFPGIFQEGQYDHAGIFIKKNGVTVFQLTAGQVIINPETAEAFAEAIGLSALKKSIFGKSVSGEDALALFGADVTGDYAVGIGRGTLIVGYNAFAFGDYAECRGENACALGSNTVVQADRGMAIGQYSGCYHADSVAIGQYSGTRRVKEFSVGRPWNGAEDPGFDRIVACVAPGTQPNDAASVAQIRDQNTRTVYLQWFGTQAEYDAITTKNPAIIYNIFEA